MSRATTLWRCILLWILCSLPFTAAGQSAPEQAWESWLERYEQSNAYSEQQLEQLQLLLADPLDLNRASRAQLLALQLLQEAQVDSLLAYRHRYGRFTAVEELQAVGGMQAQDAERLWPFVQVAQGTRADPLWKRMRYARSQQLLLRTQYGWPAPRGQQQGQYQGGPLPWQLRWKWRRSQDYSLAFTLAKDAGEPWQQGQASGHAALWQQGALRIGVVGDYTALVGQGLLMGQAGYYLGKSSEPVLGICRPAQLLMPYSGTLPTGFQRGAAALLAKGRWSAMLLASRLRRDAVLDSPYVSLSESGLHRTASEIAHFRQLDERSAGAQLRYSTPAGSLGVQGLWTQYGQPILERPTYYNKLDFKGKTYAGMSADGQWRYRNLQLFGEAAYHLQSQAWALLGGMQLSVGRKLEMAWMARRYDPAYYSPLGQGFAEGSQPANERGLYWGVRYQHSPRWSFSGYWDFFRFPHARYGAAAPSGGSDLLLRAHYRPHKRLQAWVLLQQEEKEQNAGDTPFGYRLAPALRQKLNAQLEYQLQQGVEWRCGLRACRYAQEQTSELGVMLYQELRLKLRKVQLSGRIALFDTDSYQARVYGFEHQLPGAYALQAYEGQGLRTYLMLRLQPLRQVSCWLRYSHSRYTDRQQMGSGYELREGDRRGQLQLQAVWQY